MESRPWGWMLGEIQPLRRNHRIIWDFLRLRYSHATSPITNAFTNGAEN
jgi:hypothetical protein